MSSVYPRRKCHAFIGSSAIDDWFAMTHSRLFLLGASLTSCFHAARGLEAKDVLSYSLGRTTFFPRVNLSSTYSDNVAYNDRFPVSDMVMSIAPGMGVQFGRMGENMLTASYQLEQIFYLENDQFNAQNHSFQISGLRERGRFKYNHSASLQYQTTLIGGTVSDPLLFGSSLKAGRFIYNTVHVLDYTLSTKTGIYVGPSYTATDYEEGTPLFDTSDVSGVVGFRYTLTPKTHLFGEMQYGQSEVDPNRSADVKGPSSTALRGFVGTRFDFSSRISGSVKVGYEIRSFQNDAPAPSEPVVSASVTYKPAQKTSVYTFYSRSSSLSIQSSSETAVSDSLGLTLSQQIGNTGKFGATTGLAYQTSSYVSSASTGRTDEFVSATVGFFYNFQLWFKTGVGYSHTQSTSSLPAALGYTENRVALTVSVGY